MTSWSFNLRSGSYSDSDDDSEAISASDPNRTASVVTNSSLQDPGGNSLDTLPRTLQNDTSRELEELFGGIEDDAIVNYKPNPWNIAKINANARASTTGFAKSAKSASKPLDRKPAGNKRQFFPKSKGAGNIVAAPSPFTAKVCWHNHLEHDT